MKHLILSPLLLFILVSCGSVNIKTKPVWKPEIKKIDGVVSAPLKKFLKSKASPKVVLRVPNVASTITQSDTTFNGDYSTFFGQFEMELVKQGFVLRDRALLQSLMSSGMSDYAAIGKKIDTDLIIEITNIKFAGEFQHAKEFVDDKNNTHIFEYKVDNQIFTMEVRIIQVKTGEVGSILKIKTSVYEIFDKEYVTYRGPDYLPSDYIDPEYVHYIVHPRSYSYEKVVPKLAERFSKILIDRLRGDI